MHDSRCDTLGKFLHLAILCRMSEMRLGHSWLTDLQLGELAHEVQQQHALR